MAVERRARRRWLQFSLGGILALITAIGVALGLYVNRVQRQHEVVALVKQHGGELAYDYQRDRKGRPPGPKWARAWLGDDFFSDLIVVSAPGIKTDDSRLSSIGGLRRLVRLDLQDCAAGDAVFRQFGGLTELNRLNLGGTTLSGPSLLALNRLTKLTRLDVHGTKITDASLEALRGMSELEHLDLGDTSIGDAGLEHLRQLPSLRYLNLAGTQVSNRGLKALNAIPALVAISLHGSQVTEDGLKQLKACATLDAPTPPVKKALIALATGAESTAWVDQPLSNILEYYQERYDVEIVLDERAKATLGGRGDPRIDAQVNGLLLSDALKAILKPFGLTYAIRYETLFVTQTPHAPRTRIQEPSDGAATSSELIKKLGQPVTDFQFVDQPLGAILQATSSRYGIRVDLEDGIFNSDMEADEYLESPVTINLKIVSMKSALELLLDGLNARCRIEADALVIAPRKKTPAGH